MRATHRSFAIDDSALLYLALMRKSHTNIYRFTITLPDTVEPQLLQQAADRIYKRLPTIFAGFQPAFFAYRMIPATQAPRVAPDPGLLHTMTLDEIHSCACRIYHNENQIIWEAFHALTDGYGAITTIRSLVAEYIHLRYGCSLPECALALEEPHEEELRDSYPDYADASPARVPGRYAYQLPDRQRGSQIREFVRSYPTESLLKAARAHGVSITEFLASLMAETIMEIQENAQKSLKPVRIMVPIDLRRSFPSRTLRNFILYALPTLEPAEAKLPRAERMQRFRKQLKEQTTREFLAPQISSNVRIQRSLWFRMIPRSLKSFAMRTGYRFCGESNSSITLTNLGKVHLSDEMARYVQDITCLLTPRACSPYNCGILSIGGQVRICITRFNRDAELENRFFNKVSSLCQ